MPPKIEDYALIGDTETAALVKRDGSIDWLCVPRFDSSACFAALLGDACNGRWRISPPEECQPEVSRRYRDGTLILETTFRTSAGAVRLTDFMPVRGRYPTVVRWVEGLEGALPMRMELAIRFDYGSVVPWVRRLPDGRLLAVGGPDALTFSTSVEHQGQGLSTVADFTVAAGQRYPFVLTWHPSHKPSPEALDAAEALQSTEAWWLEWSGRCAYDGPWRKEVVSSLVTLKGLTYAPTGGIVAAATTSLPERMGGVRNWDYRYCWVRDATFTLDALMLAGYREEAVAWRDWLLRSVAGDPSKLQIMYGVRGERRLPEVELAWLPGFGGSRPVRIGNAAVGQLQLDVYGELMDALHQTRREGLTPNDEAWRIQSALLDYLESNWFKPDAGLWETRGVSEQFTHSKIMTWVAFDRCVKAVEHFGLEGPVARWREIRQAIHADVCAKGWNAQKKSFSQVYGSDRLDASLLLIPEVGFLPPEDPRVRGTIAAIERELLRDGFVRRYPTEGQDGLPAGEGAFLACTFWLADCYAVTGRKDEARALFERLLSLRNDVGLLAEEYDPVGGQMLGNFPQAFSHVGLVNTAFNLTPHQPTPAVERSLG